MTQCFLVCLIKKCEKNHLRETQEKQLFTFKDMGKCNGCGEYGSGRFDTTDKKFYCHACWQEYEQGGNEKPPVQAGGPKPKGRPNTTTAAASQPHTKVLTSVPSQQAATPLNLDSVLGVRSIESLKAELAVLQKQITFVGLVMKAVWVKALDPHGLCPAVEPIDNPDLKILEAAAYSAVEKLLLAQQGIAPLSQSVLQAGKNVDEAMKQVQEQQIRCNKPELAKADLRDAEARVRDAEARLDRAEARLKDAKADLRDAEARVRDAKADLRDAEARLKDAKAEFERQYSEKEKRLASLHATVDRLFDYPTSGTQSTVEIVSTFCCFVCGKNQDQLSALGLKLSRAHIIADRIWDDRNLFVLCGSKGVRDSCHALYDSGTFEIFCVDSDGCDSNPRSGNGKPYSTRRWFSFTLKGEVKELQGPPDLNPRKALVNAKAEKLLRTLTPEQQLRIHEETLRLLSREKEITNKVLSWLETTSTPDQKGTCAVV